MRPLPALALTPVPVDSDDDDEEEEEEEGEADKDDDEAGPPTRLCCCCCCCCGALPLLLMPCGVFLSSTANAVDDDDAAVVGLLQATWNGKTKTSGLFDMSRTSIAVDRSSLNEKQQLDVTNIPLIGGGGGGYYWPPVVSLTPCSVLDNWRTHQFRCRQRDNCAVVLYVLLQDVDAAAVAGQRFI